MLPSSELATKSGALMVESCTTHSVLTSTDVDTFAELKQKLNF